MDRKADKRDGFIKKAEQLKPEIYKTVVTPDGNLPTAGLKQGDCVVFDFGNHYVGRLKLHCSFEGSHPDAPAFLKLKFCETAREIDEDTSSYAGWISKGWIQEEWLHIDVLPAWISLPRRYAFRYVKVEVLDVSGKYSLIIDQVEAETYSSAEDACAGSFSGTKMEQALDRISLRTLRNCMQDVFEDGPKRDRRLWIGDLRLQAMANYVSFGKNDLVKRCLYLFAGTADDEGRVRACLFTEPEIEGDDTYMFDYSLFFIPILRQYLEKTGDRETAEELLDTAIRQIEIAKKQFDKRHLIQDSDVVGWCFLDWNLQLNKQAGAQAVYIYCEKELVRLLELLGKTESAEEYAADAEKKAQAAKAFLYDEEKGVFVSGEVRQVSYASQAWFVLAEVFDKEKNREILKRVQNMPDALKMVTPYMYHNFIEALIQVGELRQSYEMMTTYWGGMVLDGADTFYELFNPENPQESPYGSSVVNSYCHAWSCTPVYFMRERGLVEKNLKFQGIIFDLDGVICSTDEYHYQAWKEVADRIGVYFDREINNRLRGVSRMESLEIILEKSSREYTQEEKEELAAQKNEIYKKLLENMSENDLSSEVKETLDALRAGGAKLAIGSSSKNTKRILARLGLADYFDAISDGTNITRSKPDPEVFLKAAEYLKLEPEHCLVVEDAPAGVEAAIAGGFACAGIGEAAKDERTTYPLSRFADLRQI